MNTKTIFTVTAMVATIALAGCSSHRAQHHDDHNHEPASFKAFMKANSAATEKNMMVITPIKLPKNND